MLEYNRVMKKRVTLMTRILAVMLPIVCIVLLLTQTAFAENTYLINDGGKVLIHTTHSTDPVEILTEAGLELGTDDTYTTQPGLGVSEITVQRSHNVTVVHGKTTLQLQTRGETVGELLSRAGITQSGEDMLSASLDAETHDGMILTISRAMRTEEIYTVQLPYNTTYCYDPSLPEGEEAVLTQGVNGQLLCTADVFYVNGVEVSRSIRSETVVQQPVNAVIAIGSGSAAVESESNITIAPDVCAALEQAAASGKPVILDGLIVTPEGEVLEYTSADVYRATAYHNSDPGCTIWTATGTLCRVGAIAVDPKVIPYGTRMYIVSNDGKYIYGIAVAEDCGGSIKGKRIDLYYDSVAECNQFGIRDCTVYFLD